MWILYFLKRYVYLTMVVCAGWLSLGRAFGQEKDPEEDERGVHKVSVSLGHAHVHEGIEGDEKKWLVMGSWGINYDYLINSRWAIGFHNDVILEEFKVEDHHGEDESSILERERPWAAKLVGSFKPFKHLSLLAGAGEEIAKEKNYFISTAGIEYGWHLPGGWELGAEISYDVKWNAYDTWIAGVGISKLIHGHRPHKD